MYNTISREDALNAINRIWDKCEEIEAHLPEGDPDKTGYKMIADYLIVWKYLSAQPEQQWTLCSEGLPEVDELVLVTDDSGGIKTVDVDRCGQYDSGKRFWYYTQNVVAWMPLPEPYQEGVK